TVRNLDRKRRAAVKALRNTHGYSRGAKISVKFVREPAVPEGRTDGCAWSANHGTAPTELFSILVQNLLTYH
ncbi:hypothetical protein, partial [Cryobacterium sp. TMT2-4]|uniref:hypothetical protein n=1 Tax=Cryobacterium sp. TMT2-4 TaxID=1259254 RepID=UPI001A7E0905